MTTLSPTKARGNLTGWLKKAANGEDIGILYGDQVIALRPVKVESTDYAWTEYGLTRAEMKRIAKKLHEEGEKDRKRENLVVTPATSKPSLKIEFQVGYSPSCEVFQKRTEK